MSNIETTYDRGVNYSAKQARLKKDEEELEALMKEYNKQRGGQVEEEEVEQEEEQEQEVVEQEDDPIDTPEEDDNNEADEDTDKESKDPWEKRYGDLRRHAAKKEKELKEKIKALENSVGNPEVPTVDENIEKWRNQYPDLAAIVERIAEKKASEKFQGFEEMKRDATRQKAETLIMQAHPDFEDLRQDGSDLHVWAAEQPSWIQDALYENEDDAKAVVRILDFYKADRGLNKTEKPAKKSTTNKQKEAARSVARNKGGKVDADSQNGTFRESDINKMSDKEFAEKYDQIQDAMKNGKLIYDVSRPARQNFR